MMDPKPENIRGSKVSKHSFEHSIRWDYMVLGVVALYTAWKLFGGLDLGGAGEQDDRDLSNSVPVEVRETPNMTGFADGGD